MPLLSIKQPNLRIQEVKTYFLSLQASLCKTLENLDQTKQFIIDDWQKENGGGSTRILNEGKVFNKAGVNFSHVFGDRLPAAASSHRKNLQDYRFDALGVSIVIHPENPFVPTTHANVRFFIAQKEDSDPVWWFGGGWDLTPYYGFIEDCKHWHQTAFDACQPFGEHLYANFKAWCDRYFYLPHRQEARGVGGLFFDDFAEESFENSFAFIQSIGDHFIQAYKPIVEKRKDHPFDLNHKAFQRYRQGRYVEFNLLYDRGTVFGLQSQGRTESILMSLPTSPQWFYNWQPQVNSEEAKLYTDFLPIRDWLRD